MFSTFSSKIVLFVRKCGGGGTLYSGAGHRYAAGKRLMSFGLEPRWTARLVWKWRRYCWEFCLLRSVSPGQAPTMLLTARNLRVEHWEFFRDQNFSYKVAWKIRYPTRWNGNSTHIQIMVMSKAYEFMFRKANKSPPTYITSSYVVCVASRFNILTFWRRNYFFNCSTLCI